MQRFFLLNRNSVMIRQSLGTQKTAFITKYKDVVLQEVLQKGFAVFMLKEEYHLYTSFVLNALGHTAKACSEHIS